MKKKYYIFLLFVGLSYSLSAQLIINEVLYYPLTTKFTDLKGDTNPDGVRNVTEDGLIEFVNNSNKLQIENL